MDLINYSLIVTSTITTSLIAFLMCYALVITLLGSRKSLRSEVLNGFDFPEVSVLIPVKDEYEVLKSALSNLLRVNYPLDKIKVYVGVSSGCMKCLDVCKEFSQHVTAVDVGFKSKPAVLNKLLHLISSEYVLLLDCDSLISPDSISKLVSTGVRSGSCGVTGNPRPSNLRSGLIPKFFLVECLLWWKFMLGKDSLGLLVQAPGYFTLLKRSCIESLGGWDEDSLAEDNDLTLRIYASGSNVRLDDSVVFVESPIRITTLIKQRIRWYRGTLDVLRKRFKMLKYLNLRLGLDAFITYISPISPALLSIAMISNTLLGGFYNLITLALIIPQLITPIVVGEGLGLGIRLKLSLLTLPYVMINSISSWIAITTLLLGVRIGWWRTEKYSPSGVGGG